MNRINSDLMVHLSFDDFQILHACNMKYFDRIMMQFYLQGLNLIHLVMVYNNSLGVSKVCICRFFRSSLKIKENWLGYNFVFAFYFQPVSHSKFGLPQFHSPKPPAGMGPHLLSLQRQHCRLSICSYFGWVGLSIPALLGSKEHKAVKGLGFRLCSLFALITYMGGNLLTVQSLTFCPWSGRGWKWMQCFLGRGSKKD